MKPNSKKAASLRKMAGGLDDKIEAKRNTFKGANLTARRQRFINAANREADIMEVAQVALYDLAEQYETGNVAEYLAKASSKAAMTDLANAVLRAKEKGQDMNNYGFESKWYISMDDYSLAFTWLSVLANNNTPGDRDLNRKIQRMEQDAQLAGLPGYFSTSREVVETMLAHVPFSGYFRILEPSAGSGAICDVLREYFPDAWIDVVEYYNTLREILKLKGYLLAGDDFMKFEPDDRYDLIPMNPPFEKGQDMDHVRRAFGFLAPGGVLVSVMSTGPFFRGDKKARLFRTWFKNVMGESYDLPENSFKASGTTVNACYVVIRK